MFLIWKGALAHGDGGTPGRVMMESGPWFLGSFADKSWTDLGVLGTEEDMAFASKWALSQNKNKSKGNHRVLSWGFSSFV